ncbi:MAG: hypothetical protein LBJ71_03550 [Holosporaceae bacterium]|jgi:hypothetical protein|nr:hypothetical protein [Holosporaceae bacterium]
MNKIIQKLFFVILLVSCNSSWGIETCRDQFRGLNFCGKVFAETMIQDCMDINIKNRLTKELKKISDDSHLLLYVQKEENWPIFKKAFIYTYKVIPLCTKRYLTEEIVDRLQLEKVDSIEN